MQSLEIFRNEEFGEIRTVTINDEPWFVATDIAKSLGYRMASDMTRRIDDEDKDTHLVSTLGGYQKIIVVNESGLYASILGSKLESAKRFKHWVTSEVLPSIRKNGAYMTEQTIEKALTNPDFLIQLATNLKEEQEKNKQLTEKVEIMRPKEIFADAVSASHTAILVGDLAKIIKQNGYDIGQKRLFSWLRENGYLMKSGEAYNMPTQRSMELKLFEVKESTINNPDGSVRITKTTKVTGKGQVYFINKFLKEGENNG